MPSKSKFIDTEELQQIDLGDGEWVKIPVRLSYAQTEEFAALKGDPKATSIFLSKLIRCWDIKNEKGEIPQVNPENVGRLDVGTVQKISKVALKLFDGLEKKD